MLSISMVTKFRKFIAFLVLAGFIGTTILPPAYAQSISAGQLPWMPRPGVMVHLSPDYTPAILKGITIHPDNPLMFDFIIYRGDKVLSNSQKQVEYKKLIKYFLASLAVPDEDQWVNLSPYEKNRIIKDDFGKTVMGRDLLAQDYILKQITASLIYPEENLGRKFWDKVYAKARAKYGTTNVPVNTFNKVWIVPDDALVYEKGDGTINSPLTSYVIKNHLKVMLEEDYLALQKNTVILSAAKDLNKINSLRDSSAAPQNDVNKLGSQVVREIVLPALEREVNEGENFASLRQVYSGMILAAWYKRTLKESLLGQIYADKAKVKGVDQNPQNNEEIYRRYLQAYKKGVFNYIKEDADQLTNEVIPRKYFSGGTIGMIGARGGEGIAITRETVIGNNAMITDKNKDDAVLTAMDNAQASSSQENQGLDKIVKLAEITQSNQNSSHSGSKQEQVYLASKSIEHYNTKLKYLRNHVEVNSILGRMPRSEMAMTAKEQEALVNWSPDKAGLARINKVWGVSTLRAFGFAQLIFLAGCMASFQVGNQFKIQQAENTSAHGAVDTSIERTNKGKDITQTNFQFNLSGGVESDGMPTTRPSDRAMAVSDIFRKFNPKNVDKTFRTTGVIGTLAVILLNFLVGCEASFQAGPVSADFRSNTGGNGVFGLLVDHNSNGSTKVQLGLSADAHSNGFPESPQVNPNSSVSNPTSTAGTSGTANAKPQNSSIQNQTPSGVNPQVQNESSVIKLSDISYGSTYRLNGEKVKILRLYSGNPTDPDYVGTARFWVIWGDKTYEEVGAINLGNNGELLGLKTLDKASTSDLGGIDFNAAHLNMYIKRDGRGEVLPASQQDLAQLSQIQGLEPQILSIKPASETPVFSQLHPVS